MKVSELMTSNVRTCQPTDSINVAAQIMWETDCGCVPVVENDKVVGIITDRDVCMAAFTQGRRLGEMSVGSAAARNVVTVRDTDSLHRAEEVMHEAQVRRLPVLDANDRLVGLLSISDFVRHVREIGDGIPSHIIGALVGISQRRSPHTSGGASQSPAAENATQGRSGGEGSISHTATELKNELKKGVKLLRTLRDEVRVQLHLGSLDLKDQWKKLEPQLGEVEKRAEELTEASRAALADAVKKLEKFRSSLSDHR